MKAHDHPKKNSINEGKVMLGFKFILSKVEGPREKGNVNAWKKHNCIMIMFHGLMDLSLGPPIWSGLNSTSFKPWAQEPMIG